MLLIRSIFLIAFVFLSFFRNSAAQVNFTSEFHGPPRFLPAEDCFDTKPEKEMMATEIGNMLIHNIKNTSWLMNSDNYLTSGAFYNNWDRHSSIHAHWTVLTIGKFLNNREYIQFIEDRFGVEELKSEVKYVLSNITTQFYAQAWLYLLVRELINSYSTDKLEFEKELIRRHYTPYPVYKYDRKAESILDGHIVYKDTKTFVRTEVRTDEPVVRLFYLEKLRDILSSSLNAFINSSDNLNNKHVLCSGFGSPYGFIKFLTLLADLKLISNREIALADKIKATALVDKGKQSKHFSIEEIVCTDSVNVDSFSGMTVDRSYMQVGSVFDLLGMESKYIMNSYQNLRDVSDIRKNMTDDGHAILFDITSYWRLTGTERNQPKDGQCRVLDKFHKQIWSQRDFWSKNFETLGHVAPQFIWMSIYLDQVIFKNALRTQKTKYLIKF